MKLKFILVFIFLLINASFIYANIPVPEDDFPYPSLAHCTNPCIYNWDSCNTGCHASTTDCTASRPIGMIDLDQIYAYNYKCEQNNDKVYAPCRNGCDLSYGSCVKSCKLYYYGPNQKPSDYASSHSCNEDKLQSDGCCPGYSATNLGVCCKNGFDSKTQPNGVITCGPKASKVVIDSVKISVDKNELYLDKVDSIIITATFSGTNEDGTKGPLKNQGFITGYVTDLNDLDFNIMPLTTKTNNDGSIKLKLTLDKTYDSASRLDGKTVNVYYRDNPADKASFKLKVPKITATIKKLGSPKAWHNSWSNFEIKINDPAKQYKRITIDANGGLARIEGNEGKVAYASTNNNVVQFGWMAPKVSEEMRMEYTKRTLKAMIDMNMIVLEDAMGTEFNYRKDLFSSNTQNGFDAFTKLLKVDIQKAGYDTDVKMNSNKSGVGQLGDAIGAIAWTEGTIGLALPTDGLSTIKILKGTPGNKVVSKLPLITLLKVGGKGLQHWYATVDDMNKIANSKQIIQYHSFTVLVETVDGKQKTELINVEVPVEGYEFLLTDG